MGGVPVDGCDVSFRIRERRLFVICALERDFVANDCSFFADDTVFLLVRIRDKKQCERFAADVDIETTVADGEDDVRFGRWRRWFRRLFRLFVFGGLFRLGRLRGGRLGWFRLGGFRRWRRFGSLFFFWWFSRRRLRWRRRLQLVD